MSLSRVIFVLMMLVGLVSVIYRRPMVTWSERAQYRWFGIAKPSPRHRHAREMIQVVGGVLTILFGLLGLLLVRE